MKRVAAVALYFLVFISAGCSEEGNPVGALSTSNNSSYGNLYGFWISAAGSLMIDERSMTFTITGNSRYFTFAVRSCTALGYDLLMSDGEEWFVAIAGNILDIQSGAFAGEYRFSHH